MTKSFKPAQASVDRWIGSFPGPGVVRLTIQVGPTKLFMRILVAWLLVGSLARKDSQRIPKWAIYRPSRTSRCVSAVN